MTTLEQIGFTLAGGSAVFVTTIVLFGIANYSRSSFIAPRATARPFNVIHNRQPKNSSQERGGPFLGWIIWTLTLNYDTMLNGIPGTGTRENGMSGSLLRVNLDGIVLLRFIAVCLRVSIMSTLLFVGFGIPIYLTAQCYTSQEDDVGCDLSNYQRTTLANVPSIPRLEPLQTVVHQQDGILWRLYMIVGCFWIVITYLCQQLHQEWVQILAMRRVYYLEYDHWQERRKELKQTLLFEEIAEKKKLEQQEEEENNNAQWGPGTLKTRQSSWRIRKESISKPPPRFKKSSPSGVVSVDASNDNTSTTVESHLTNRDPWIPHPEQRDTVPNIALYSILVGGLPSLPEQAADSFDAAATIQFSKRESIDWQLSLTTTFFDHCVPNQPGFSSSVAAVTIIPGARDLSAAWRKWYAAASKLRRLRFIREQIEIRRHFDIEAANDHLEDDENNNNEFDSEFLRVEYGYEDPDKDEVYVPADLPDDDVSSYLADLPPHPPRIPSPQQGWERQASTPRGIYETPFKNKEYYKQVLGSALGREHDTHIYDSLEFGPEQAAVYAREFAQSAAPCCPNGCNEWRVRRATIDQLLEMERIVAIEVHEANLELREARKRATRFEGHHMENNLHDQQRGENPVQNVSTPQSVLAGGNPHHSIIGAGTASHTINSGDVTSPTSPLSIEVVDSNDSSTFPEGGGARTGGDVEDVVSALQHQPMPSRYDRRSSDQPNLDRRPQMERGLTTRLDPEQLENLAESNDLGLEAQLYKRSESTRHLSVNTAYKKSEGSTRNLSVNMKHPSQSSSSAPTGATSTAASSRGDTTSIPEPPNYLTSRKNNSALSPVKESDKSPTKSHPPPSALKKSQSSNLDGDASEQKKKKQHRRIPSLEKVNLPNNINLEAQLSSSHTGSSHVLRRNVSTASHDKSKQGKNAYESKRSPSSPQSIHDRYGNKADDDFERSSDAHVHFHDTTTSAHWNTVQEIIIEHREQEGTAPRTPKPVATGQWEFPTFQWFFRRTKEHGTNVRKFVQKQSQDAVETLARESTYAVITFTSRQAAVAARACLADGRAQDRWVTLKELPIPPLADAAPGDLLTFRNCCRPVTLSINERQKNCRNYIAIGLLTVIYVFYTIPLTIVSTWVDPETVDKLIPNSAVLDAEDRFKYNERLSGLITAGIWSLFFALCPGLFKAIAHFGSKSTSVANAEFKALQYYWWFMVLTAFSGQLLTGMGIKAVNEGLSVGSEFQSILRKIAETVPSTQSVTWLNWIIFRFTIILPLNYLLQINSFLFHCFGMYCCSRLVRGGGPGPPVPYRIYIDSGVVLMCVLALAPASPLVAPASVLYFLLCQPLFRRNLIYMYRPKFDGGGFRWPFIFDMCMSGLIVGELLLTVQMALKQAAGPTAAAAITLLPTFLFSKNMKQRYLRSFQDAALLQTSLLDGWDTATEYPPEKREEFRQFLVDAHKAAYVPICLAGTDTDEFLTAEPAVVLQDEEELVESLADSATQSGISPKLSQPSEEEDVPKPLIAIAERRRTQHGVTLRRAVNKLTALRKRTSSCDSGIFDQLIEDEKSGVSPFERSMSTRSLMVHDGQSTSVRSRRSTGASDELQTSWGSRPSADRLLTRGMSVQSAIAAALEPEPILESEKED